MPHILIAGKLHPAGLALAERARADGFTHDYVEEVSEGSYVPRIAGADAVVLRTQPLSAATVARAPRLKIVSRHGVGYDAVDLAALNARGIALAIVGDVNSVSVAEHAMMLMLAAAKRLVVADRSARDPARWDWRNRFEAREVSGRRLLILGYGRIGRHLARMAAGFGMEVRAHDPYLERAGWPEGAVRPAGALEPALGWADFVSVHVPGSGGGPLIGAREIAAMRPGAVLVNTARGGVVDEAALAEALGRGHIGAAGIDVFLDEPPKASSPLAAQDRAVLTPHIAGLSLECAERMAVAAVGNALSFFAGRIDPALIVNPEVLRGPGQAG